jgi:hypothetical protein
MTMAFQAIYRGKSQSKVWFPKFKSPPTHLFSKQELVVAITAIRTAVAAWAYIPRFHATS